VLREEHRLRAFENMVLRRIFGPKRDEMTGEWRKLHNEELNDLYYSTNIVRVIKSRRMRWAGHVAHMGEVLITTSKQSQDGLCLEAVIINLQETYQCRMYSWRLLMMGKEVARNM
jgi:hypothetical protein